MKEPNRSAQLAANRIDRQRDALNAMRDYQSEQARVDANTVRLRALRLAKEAADAALEKTAAAPKSPRRNAKSARGTPAA